jgi:poly(A) polymerase/tRNA nucleotidyltransferase (CCA-adding enzyme)
MKLPEFVSETILALAGKGFEAFIVGGCVRDILMGQDPKDWDVTTNAKPEQVTAVFPGAKYENNFGTVLLPVKDESGRTQAVVEITTYRSEQGYADRRRPDEVIFENELDKDLERRDFTINSLAAGLKPRSRPAAGTIDFEDLEMIDLFGGAEDIRKRIIRAVGEPFDRFREDSLRMMRAIRFSCQLGFDIEPKTERAICKMAGALKFIANERIRDELVKMLESDRPYEGIMLLHRSKLLQYIIPELEQGVGVAQDRHHVHSVFQHSVYSLKHCPSRDWRVRFAALIHDIAKPQTKKIIGNVATFYNHEYLGAKIAARIAKRLKFSNEDSEKIITLVRNHMFYYNVGEVTEASVRRLIRKVGADNLKDLIDLRIADRLGSGVAKAKPYKLRHLEYMFEKVRHDPVSVKMLTLNGDQLMEILGIKPGPKIGAILDVLLSEVIEDPSLNDFDHLSRRSRELDALDLDNLRKQAKEAIEGKREEDDKKIKSVHWVK